MQEHSKPHLADPGQTAAFKALHTASIGIDVHSNMLVASFQRCELGSRKLEVREVRVEPTTSRNLAEFARMCAEFKPGVIVMESTGVYWLSLYGKLEEAGFASHQICVLNARDFKPVRGKKTDQGDAERLGELGRIGVAGQSFIPGREFREFRLLERNMLRTKAVAKAAVQRVHKCMASLGCRASAVFSDIRGLAATRIIHALVCDRLQGEELLDFVRRNRGGLRHTPEEICEALEADMRSPAWDAVISCMRIADFAEAERQAAYARIKELLAPWSEWLALLQTIPGIKEAAAVQILCEIGPDLKPFASVRRFASWAGVAPGNNESAGRRTSGRITKGNKYLRTTLVEVANAISLMKGKGGRLAQYFQAMKERRGHLRAIMATAHKILRIIFAMFRDMVPYHDEPDCQILRQHRVERLRAAAEGVAEVDLELDGSASEIRITEESGRTYSTVTVKAKRRRWTAPTT